MTCHPCDANSGLHRISPAAPVSMGQFWQVEHAYPTSMEGWLVVVLRRHCETLHELTRAEWAELAELQYAALGAMNEVLGLDREYVCCFAEVEGFQHLHFHLVPKYPHAEESSVGTNAFHHLKVSVDDAVPPNQVIELCDKLRRAMETRLSP